MKLYNICADMHTHTLASQHAYGTLAENAAAARRANIRGFAKTDHGPKLTDGTHPWHTSNVPGSVPAYIDGIRVFRGVEADIIDYDGGLDISNNNMRKLEWVIASIHGPCLPESNPDAVTQLWLEIAKNKYVDCIGHSGNGNYMFDYERVIKEFASEGKIVEINNHSFTVRKGSDENCIEIARICKKHGVSIVVTSDAHAPQKIGRFPNTFAALNIVDFPEELILNCGSIDKVENFIANRKKIKDII